MFVNVWELVNVKIQILLLKLPPFSLKITNDAAYLTRYTTLNFASRIGAKNERRMFVIFKLEGEFINQRNLMNIIAYQTGNL